jgi:predicted ribosome quality control (RQC) complex YloA/Tae2 family protein
MKSQISSIDLHYLISEMQFLVDARIDKIYHPSKEELILQLHVTSKGKQLLRIISGKFMFLTEHKEDYEQPSGFCMFLRKHLGSARLRGIEQVGSERIAMLRFSTKDAEYRMYIELFGKGNIVIADSSDVIINALSQQKWADRVVMKGEKYNYPRKEFDLFKIKKAEFKKVLGSSKELVMKLAKDIGLGGLYAEEICKLAIVDKEKKKLSVAEADNVFSAFDNLRKAKIKASVLFKNGKIKEIVPLKMSLELDAKEFPSFNSAFDYFYKEEFSAKGEFKSRHQQAIDKTKSIIEQQRKQMDSLLAKAEESNKKGELIYEKYQLVDEVLKEINKAREKYSFDEIKKKLKGHRVVKQVDGKEKKVTIDI